MKRVKFTKIPLGVTLINGGFEDVQILTEILDSHPERQVLVEIKRSTQVGMLFHFWMAYDGSEGEKYYHCCANLNVGDTYRFKESEDVPKSFELIFRKDENEEGFYTLEFSSKEEGKS